MSLDAVISADLVKTRAEIAALSSAVAAARNEIAGLNTQVAGGSVIRSVQRGQITIPMPSSGSTPKLTVNVASVNPIKSVLHYLGNIGIKHYSNSSVFNGAMVALVSATQIEITPTVAPENGYTPGVTVSWELVEFK